MPITDPIKVEKKEAADYPPLPKDVYQVQLLDVTSKQNPTYDTRNKSEAEKEYETIFSFQFVLLEGIQQATEKEVSLRGRNVWANFVPSYLYCSAKNGKNKLYRITEAFLGRDLTQEDEMTMDADYLNALIGKQCRISVEPKTKGDKTFDNITDWLKANSQLTPLTDEEKEKATVKEKKGDGNPNGNEELNKPDEVKVEDIPF